MRVIFGIIFSVAVFSVAVITQPPPPLAVIPQLLAVCVCQIARAVARRSALTPVAGGTTRSGSVAKSTRWHIVSGNGSGVTGARYVMPRELVVSSSSVTSCAFLRTTDTVSRCAPR